MPSSDHLLNAGTAPENAAQSTLYISTVGGISIILCSLRSRRVKSLARAVLFKDIPCHICHSFRAQITPSGTGLPSQGTFLADSCLCESTNSRTLRHSPGPVCSCYPHILILTSFGKKEISGGQPTASEHWPW